jgi:hypothetical protein
MFLDASFNRLALMLKTRLSRELMRFMDIMRPAIKITDYLIQVCQRFKTQNLMKGADMRHAVYLIKLRL